MCIYPEIYDGGRSKGKGSYKCGVEATVSMSVYIRACGIREDAAHAVEEVLL